MPEGQWICLLGLSEGSVISIVVVHRHKKGTLRGSHTEQIRDCLGSLAAESTGSKCQLYECPDVQRHCQGETVWTLHGGSKKPVASSAKAGGKELGSSRTSWERTVGRGATAEGCEHAGFCNRVCKNSVWKCWSKGAEWTLANLWFGSARSDSHLPE